MLSPEIPQYLSNVIVRMDTTRQERDLVLAIMRQGARLQLTPAPHFQHSDIDEYTDI